MNGRILIIDDEPNIRLMLSGVLADEGYTPLQAESAEGARELLEGELVDLALLDIRLPGASGLELLRELHAAGNGPPVIMMSGHGSIDNALEAISLGALDFIEKPIQPARLLVSLEKGLQLHRLSEENQDLRQAMAATEEIVGGGPALTRLRREITRVAASEARVLITGDNGTGKELVARALHGASPRRERPFIKINCAAIPSELLESELFGHERGAFTGALNRRRGKFERAQGGTILLDEIGDMNATTQAKLLRVLEEGEMERIGGEQTITLDVRIFASTNRDLESLMGSGAFRRDLYHRLKVVPIHVPPLREHSEDVVELAEHYLTHFCTAGGRPQRRLDPEARRLLTEYGWPGNVRELRNLAERLVIMVEGEVITAVELAPLLGEAPPDRMGESQGDLAARLLAFERRQVGAALEEAGGNVAAAARILGLDRANLHRRLVRLDLKQ